MSQELDRPDFSALGHDSPDPAEVASTVRARLADRNRRRRQLSIVGTIAAVIAVAATAVSIGVLSPSGSVPPAGEGQYRPEVNSSGARCYFSADLSIDEEPLNWVSMSIGSKNENEIVPAAPHALSWCKESWEQTDFGTERSGFLEQQGLPSAAPRTAPDLVACILPPAISDDGLLEMAVFPGDGSTCSELGLELY